ncbi:MAG: diaminopimelate decarboxylase [Mycobacterium sp.]
MTLLDILPSLRHAARPRLDPALWPITTHTDDEGRLCVGGTALTEVADEFGTPAYVVDEDDFRHRARRHRKMVTDIEVVYAAKALLTTRVAGWAADEGLGVAVCTAGELATALAGGVDPARIVLHGAAKTPDELRNAVAAGVGRIVLGSLAEIAYLGGLAARRQRVLLRCDQDDPAEAVRRILHAPNLDLVGLQCDAEAAGQAIAAMADIRNHERVLLCELNLGEPGPDLGSLDDAVDAACAAERFPRPRVVIEPGWAISAQAGVSLYRVCGLETRPDGRTVVVVDGGSSEVPGCGATLANRHALGPTRMVTVAGRCGDELIRSVELPADVHPGDLLAVPSTGLAGRPAVVSVRHGRARGLVRRETTADLLARDMG